MWGVLTYAYGVAASPPYPVAGLVPIPRLRCASGRKAAPGGWVMVRSEVSPLGELRSRLEESESERGGGSSVVGSVGYMAALWVVSYRNVMWCGIPFPAQGNAFVGSKVRFAFR